MFIISPDRGGGRHLAGGQALDMAPEPAHTWRRHAANIDRDHPGVIFIFR